MSKEWGIIYHHGGRLRKDKGWSEKTYVSHLITLQAETDFKDFKDI